MGAAEEFVVKKGEMTFQGDMEYQLRTLGMPVKLDHGKIFCEKDHVVCRKGDVLTPEQCKLLKLFEQRQAVFSIEVLGHWDKKSNKYVSFSKEDDMPAPPAPTPAPSPSDIHAPSPTRVNDALDTSGLSDKNSQVKAFLEDD